MPSYSWWRQGYYVSVSLCCTVSLYVCVCLSVCMSVCLSVCLSVLLQSQFRRTGHVMRMSGTHITKQVFCGQLAEGKRLLGGQHKRYKDWLKQNLKTCAIPLTELNSTMTARGSVRSRCHDAIDDLEDTRHPGEVASSQDSDHPERWTVGMWSLRSCLWFPDQSLYAHRKFHRWGDPFSTTADSMGFVCLSVCHPWQREECCFVSFCDAYAATWNSTDLLDSCPRSVT